jgi:hypothetical protein
MMITSAVQPRYPLIIPHRRAEAVNIAAVDLQVEEPSAARKTMP